MIATPILVQFDFPFSGPFGSEMEAALKDLATSITREPGFLWKIWTEDETTKEAGGIYLFRDRASANAYVAKHSARLEQFGVSHARVRVFNVNQGLTSVTHGPVSPAKA